MRKLPDRATDELADCAAKLDANHSAHERAGELFFVKFHPKY